MKRNKPLKVKTGLKRAEGLKRTPLQGRSAKRDRLMATDRAPLVRRLIRDGRKCEIGPILEAHGLGGHGCTGLITGLHERRKRSSGGSLTNPQNLIPACSWCNGFVEDEPAQVRHHTGDLLVVRPGDPEWDALGARQDRFEGRDTSE